MPVKEAWIEIRLSDEEKTSRGCGVSQSFLLLVSASGRSRPRNRHTARTSPVENQAEPYPPGQPRSGSGRV